MKINNQKNFESTLNLPVETIPLDAKLTKKQGYFLESLQDPKKYKDAENKNKQSESVYNISKLPNRAIERLNPKDIVNEIYKDVLTRYECMQGNIVNHDIGFLYTATKEDEESLRGEDIVKKRIAYQKNLHEFIQSKIYDIRTLGTVLDYSKNCYSTISNDFALEVIDKFYDMYKRGSVKLEYKPMHYCNSCGKYFGKNEVDYVKKRHINLYAMYRVKDDKGTLSRFNNLRNTYVIATTIYPWIIGVSENLVIKKDTVYCVVEVEQLSSTHHYIIQKDKVQEVMINAFYTKYNIKAEITSDELESFVVISPIDYTKEINIISASESLVSPYEKNNTGIRVILPEYSYIDYLVYKEKNIPLPSPAINTMKVVIKGDNHIKGKSIDEANTFLINYIKKGELIFLEDYIALTCPVCKTCRNDLFYINKPAFYIKKDEEKVLAIKEKVKEKIENSNCFTEGKKKDIIRKISNIDIKNELQISNYGSVGVPIPIYCCDGCNDYIINDETVRLTKEYIKNKGMAYVNTAKAQDILKGTKICDKCEDNLIAPMEMIFNDDFRQMAIPIVDDVENNPKYSGKKCIDVLIESKNDFVYRLKLLMFDDDGALKINSIEKFIIHSDVKEDTKIIGKPILFDKKNKQEMQNLLTTQIGIRDVSKKYGTDILRLWGVLTAGKKTITLNEQSIIKANNLYRILRKTIRYLLGNLQEFNPNTSYIPVEKREDLDKYAYKKLYDISLLVKEEYEQCNFNIACEKIIDFCKNTLCRDYFNAVKYRLYILKKEDKSRMMVLSTMFDIFMQLVIYLEPIIPFTLEEAWQYAWHSTKDEEKNILMHRESISLSKIENGDFEVKWEKIFKFTLSAKKKIRDAISKKIIKNSLEAALILNVLEEKREFLEENKENIKDALNISEVKINVVDDKSKRKVEVVKKDGEMCARCRHYTLDVGRDVRYVYLCENCVKILENEK